MWQLRAQARVWAGMDCGGAQDSNHRALAAGSGWKRGTELGEINTCHSPTPAKSWVSLAPFTSGETEARRGAETHPYAVGELNTEPRCPGPLSLTNHNWDTEQHPPLRVRICHPRTGTGYTC
ncbi:hypothetical protein KIL84_021691 [Mauremys mutica]|uniref:Uncharacterized protein n=1 Tax=Mauremys mutica TaxID=74926 RepID=A0A9D3X996_9SAUR|nr:hypothetical protein KIL84_021691 [Mauremys mutica]